MKTLRIWTFGYRPFICGGNVNYILATTVECESAVDLGKGFKGHLVKVPGTRKTRVAEAITGAIIGDTLAAVRSDVKKATKAVMDKQIADAKHALYTMDIETLKPKEFWKRHVKT